MTAAAFRRLIAIAPLALFAAPVAAEDAAPARAPVEIDYDTGMNCAIFAGFSAVLLDGSEGELAERQAYYDKVGDLWLDALGRADPEGQEHLMKDFEAKTEAFVLAFKADADAHGQDVAIGNLIDANAEKCAALELGVFGTDEAQARTAQ